MSTVCHIQASRCESGALLRRAHCTFGIFHPLFARVHPSSGRLPQNHLHQDLSVGMLPAIALLCVLSVLRAILIEATNFEYRSIVLSEWAYLCLCHLISRLLRVTPNRDSRSLGLCRCGRELSISTIVPFRGGDRRATCTFGAATDDRSWLSDLFPNQDFFRGSRSGMLRNGKRLSSGCNTTKWSEIANRSMKVRPNSRLFTDWSQSEASCVFSRCKDPLFLLNTKVQ